MSNIIIDDLTAAEAVEDMAMYCSQHTDCKDCNLRPFCKSINPVVKLEYIYNQTVDRLENIYEKQNKSRKWVKM